MDKQWNVNWTEIKMTSQLKLKTNKLLLMRAGNWQTILHIDLAMTNDNDMTH